MRRIQSALTSLLAAAVLVACADGITAPADLQFETLRESCDSTDSSSDCFGGTQGPNN